MNTICALATPHGLGGVAIIRLSGDASVPTLEKIFRATHPHHPLPAHRMMHGFIFDPFSGEDLDEVLAVIMPAPNSYTREDVAEIHCHGGEVSARRILTLLLKMNIVPAAPGEFTRRAFLNGRIDLTRAEAVMQLIGATGEAAARASMRQLEGGVSGFVKHVSDGLRALLALIEAGVDFPDEVEEEAVSGEMSASVAQLIDEIETRCDPRGARILRQGASIVLAGKPNVGKSSLMNALLNQDRAIVTSVPGTTRDVLTERLTLGGVLCELSDTAGQRDAADPVEKIGVDRAKAAMERADVVLTVLDASQPLEESDFELLKQADARTIIILNKSDLAPAFDASILPEAEVISLSAATGENIDALLSALQSRVTDAAKEDGLTVERHIKLAQNAAQALRRAQDALKMNLPTDVVALDLQDALSALGEITAQDASESVIDEIFSKFCVGK